MQTRVQKWGNSLAIRIPRGLAIKGKLNDGSLIDLSEIKGKLVITPVKDKQYSLAQLLSKLSDDNIHQESETGKAEGKEVW